MSGEEVHLRGSTVVSDTTQRELQVLTGKHHPLPPPISSSAAQGPTEAVKSLPKPVRVSRILQATRDEERAAAKLAPVLDHSIPLPQYVFAHTKPHDVATPPHPPIEASPRQPAVVTTAPASSILPVVTVQPPPSVSYSDKDNEIGPKRGLPVRLINILRGLAPWPDTSRPKSPRLDHTPHPTVASPPPPVVSPALAVSVRSAESYLCLDPQYTREGIVLRVAALPPLPEKPDRPAVGGHVENPTYVDPNTVHAVDGAAAAHAGQVRTREGTDEGREGKKTRMADAPGSAALDLASASVSAQSLRPEPEVYLVDAEWYQEWQHRSASLAAGIVGSGGFVQPIAASPSMSPLCNNRLVDPPGSDRLRRGLREGHEFVTVSESLWGDFHERYRAGPPIRRTRIPTHSGQPKTVLYPVWLHVPSMQHGSPITFDETFSLKELKYYLCTKLSQPPHRCRLMLRRATMTATEICSDDDHRTVFESNIRSGDFVGIQRDGMPDRIEVGPPAASGASYPATSAQMGITSHYMDDEIRSNLNVRDNYYNNGHYDPAYPSSSRHAGDIIRPVIGASRATSGPYYPEFDDAELAAAIAASLQDAPAPSGGQPGSVQVLPVPAAPTTQGMPPLLPPQQTEHRPTLSERDEGMWREDSDDDLTEDEHH